MALFGLGLRPLLFISRVLGGVSVGVPRLRGRALRAFWDIESDWVFIPLHLTAEVKAHMTWCKRKQQTHFNWYYIHKI